MTTPWHSRGTHTNNILMSTPGVSPDGREIRWLALSQVTRLRKEHRFARVKLTTNNLVQLFYTPEDHTPKIGIVQPTIT